MKDFFENNTLKNKVIVVSGGTKGVGRSIVIECLKCGANVVFGGRDREAAAKLLKETEKYNEKCKFVYTELKKTEDCKKLFVEAIDLFGKIDGFVNYAGFTPVASVIDCEEKVFDDAFDVNIKAPFFCCKYALNHMLKNKSGSIILVGSAHSSSGEKDRAAYACSKGALYTLFEHIAHNYAKDGIRCNMLTMGWTPTEGEISLRHNQGMSKEELDVKASEIIPMGRMLKPEDYIAGIIYLLSDYSSMSTGTNLRITGGEYI